MYYNNDIGARKTNMLDILIVEDDEDDVKGLTAEINANADKLHLAGVSKSSHNAFDFIRNHNPHAVILDLELHEGCGDGVDLLDKLRSTALCRKPYVIVNTLNPSRVTRDTVKRMGADYTFTKCQAGYTYKMVINHLLCVLPSLLGCEEQPSTPLSEEQLDNKMRSFVQDEFNKLGVSINNEGYGYLLDAVILAAKDENQNWGKIIGERIGKSEDAVMHAMQYAIKRTWKKADINCLQQYYTAYLNKDNPVPTTTAFVFYYKQKLISYLHK